MAHQPDLVKYPCLGERETDQRNLAVDHDPLQVEQLRKRICYLNTELCKHQLSEQKHIPSRLIHQIYENYLRHHQKLFKYFARRSGFAPVMRRDRIHLAV